MKNKSRQTIHSTAPGPYSGRVFKSALATAAFLCAVANSQAQISVTPSGSSGTLTFGTQPLASEFATYVLTGTGATYVDPAAMDAGVQTLDAATIVNQLTAVAQATPGTFAGGMRWNSTTLYLQSRPTTSGTNAAGVMKATLQNNSGEDLTEVTVSYDFAVFNGVAEEVPGFRVFWSLTGAPGTWTLLPTLSGNETVGTQTESIGATVWPAGSLLYLLWADDNDDGLSDQGQTIDNFVVSGISTVVSPITITNQPQNLIVDERGSATFTVGASGTPQTFFWFSNSVQVLGNNTPTFTIPSAAYPANNGAQIYVVVSNSLGAVTSSTATLTVNPDIVAPTIVRVVGNPGLDTVTITFSEAILGSGVNPTPPDPAAFVLYPTGSDPDTDYLLTTGAVFANPSNIVITTDLRIAGTNYSLRVLDIRDDSSQQNVIDPNPTDVQFITQNVLMVDFDDNNIWKYSTETNLYGTGWETVAYDDTGVTWLEGSAGLGLDVSANGVPIRTVTAYAAHSEPQFFRRHFNLPALTNGLLLNMRHVFEDGAVVFLNGQEAGRYNVAAGTALVDGARAAVNQTDPTPISGPVPLPLTNVFPGDNVIAVVVLQNGNTSSDIEMAIELEVSIPQYPSGPVVIETQPAAATTVNEGQSFSLSVVASGAVPITYQWRKGGVDLPGQTSPSFGVAAALPSDGGTYTVAVSNSINGLISANAVVTVNPDTTPPAFLSAVADTNLTNITLVFGERLNQANAENPAHYDVHLTAGGGNLTIVSATLVNNTNVVLVTSARTQSQGYTVVLSGVTDNAAALNPATPSSRPVTCEIIILAPDPSTAWRYDSSSNILDGLGWELTGYNDSAWPTALAGFTTSNAFEITPAGFELRSTNMLAPNTGGPNTTYYRVPFNLPATSLSGVTLHLVGVVDDGLVAYVNGVEAGRLRMTNASPVSFTNVTSAGSPETTDNHTAEVIVLTNLTGLVTGNNLLAIELHQQNATSSDAVLSVQVVAGIQEFTVAGPTLHVAHNLDGSVTVSWTGGGTLQSTLDLLTSGTVWTDVPGNPNPYTFTPLPGEPVKFFSLR